MKRIYACFAIVAALLATAFYSSFQVQKFADAVSEDLDTAVTSIRSSNLPSARQALSDGADLCDTMREKMNHLLRTADFTELEAALRTAHRGRVCPLCFRLPAVCRCGKFFYRAETADGRPQGRA